MADFTIDIDKYDRDLMLLRNAITDVSAAGYRYSRANPMQEHRITVQAGQAGSSACTLYMRESNFYLVGLRVGQKSYGFMDAKPLSVAAGNVQIWGNLSESYTKTGKGPLHAAFTRDDVIKAIEDLSKHAGGRNETFMVYGEACNDLRRAFGIMCCIIAEAMRFKAVFEGVAQTLRDRSSQKSYDPPVSLFKSWQTTTNDAHMTPKLMQKPSKHPISTWHHFHRGKGE